MKYPPTRWLYYLLLLLPSLAFTQQDFDVTFYPSTYQFIKSIETPKDIWTLFASVIWQTNKETGEVQFHTMGSLESDSEFPAARRFYDMYLLDDDRLVFFTIYQEYFVYENGQFRQETHELINYPKVYGQLEENTLLLSSCVGGCVRAINVDDNEATPYFFVPSTGSSYVQYYDNEGYYWIRDFYNQQIRREKSQIIDTIAYNITGLNNYNYYPTVSADNQLAMWWNADSLALLHQGTWHTFRNNDLGMKIERTFASSVNSILLFGGNRILECRVNAQQEVELVDVSSTYNKIARESLHLNLENSEEQWYFHWANQELWYKGSSTVPEKINRLPVAPNWISRLKQDRFGKIWCTTEVGPYFLQGNHWVAPKHFFLEEPGQLSDIDFLPGDRPVILQRNINDESKISVNYAGYWHLLNPPLSSNALPNLSYNWLYVAPDNEIWAVDNSGGFSLFSQNERTDFSLARFFPSPVIVYSLRVNEQGQLLMATNIGLYLIERNGNYEHLSTKQLGLPAGGVLISAKFDQQGALWFNNNQLLGKYHYGQSTILLDYTEQNPGNVSILSVEAFANDDIWVNIRQDRNSFLHYDGQEWALIQTRFDETDYSLGIYNVVRAADNSYWTQGIGGLYKLTPKPSTSTNEPLDKSTLTAYPNPACCNFTVSWQQEATEVSIVLYNALGQPVRELLRRTTEGGSFQQTFSRFGLQNGAFYIQLISGDQQESIPLILH